MTPEEALKILEDFLRRYHAFTCKTIEAMRVAKKAVEKQIAKKPTDNKCPCGSYVKARKRFCGTCGQKLEWGDAV